jgi:hypothetical protein
MLQLQEHLIQFLDLAAALRITLRLLVMEILMLDMALLDQHQ